MRAIGPRAELFHQNFTLAPRTKEIALLERRGRLPAGGSENACPHQQQLKEIIRDEYGPHHQYSEGWLSGDF